MKGGLSLLIYEQSKVVFQKLNHVSQAAFYINL